MKAIKIQYLGILLLTQLAGCLGNNGTTATTSNVAGISYDGATAAALLTPANSATLLSGAYQGGQTGTALGSVASLTEPASMMQQPRTLLLSQALQDAVQQALRHGVFTPSTAAAATPISNQLTGNCGGGQMNYSGTVNDGTREFYIKLTFDNYCQDGTTVNGAATASGQMDESEPDGDDDDGQIDVIDPTTGKEVSDGDDDDGVFNTATFNQDMYNDKTLAPNSYSITFDPLTISSLGSSFSARGYALVTKTDETDSDADVDATGSEPINPNNTPDTDDDPAADEYPDNGGVTTIKLDILLEDDATKAVYKAQDFNIALTNRVDADPNCSTYVDANLNGRYFDPSYGYIDLSTSTPLKVCPKEYWPSSGVIKAVGAPGAMTTTTSFNSSASLTVTGYDTYQLDVDSSGSGQSESTTTGTWPTP